MRRLQPKPPTHDFKSNFFCKLLFFLGFIFLILYLIQITTHLFTSDETLAGILLAFIILSFGFGALSYFLSCQFSKLADIAREIENQTDEDQEQNQK